MELLVNGDVTPTYATEDCILFNNDCRDLLKNIKDESIDLFCSDIPYRVSSSGGGVRKERKEIYAVEYLIVMIIQKKIKIIL